MMLEFYLDILPKTIFCGSWATYVLSTIIVYQKMAVLECGNGASFQLVLSIIIVGQGLTLTFDLESI